MTQNKIHLTIFLAGIIALLGCHTENTSDKNIAKEGGEKEAVKENNTTNETFILMDSEKIEELNKTIISMEIEKKEDVVQLYRPVQEPPEGNYSYAMSSKEIDKHTTEYTIIETGLLDDSVEGLKTVMTITGSNGLRILSIKQNYRCYRGHREWSAENCL